jgi:hypothetical protein
MIYALYILILFVSWHESIVKVFATDILFPDRLIERHDRKEGKYVMPFRQAERTGKTSRCKTIRE